MNAIRRINKIQDSPITNRDILSALFKTCGGRVSDMPDEVEGSRAHHGRWELFDPELVNGDADDLSEPWDIVYEMHNAPDMTDCVKLRYRYVHCPVDIFPSFPRIRCKGVFALCDRSVNAYEIREKDLVFIGDSVEEFEQPHNPQPR